MKKEAREEMTLGRAEELAMETDYAWAAYAPEGNEINKADAGAFFLEGYNYAIKQHAKKIEEAREIMRMMIHAIDSDSIILVDAAEVYMRTWLDSKDWAVVTNPIQPFEDVDGCPFCGDPECTSDHK